MENEGIAVQKTAVDVIGNVADIIVRLKKQMLKEAEALNFEEAGRLRDRIKELERLELVSDGDKKET